MSAKLGGAQHMLRWQKRIVIYIAVLLPTIFIVYWRYLYFAPHAKSITITVGQTTISFTTPNLLIPNQIWQIMLPRKANQTVEIPQDARSDVESWAAMNPSYHYDLVDWEWASNFLDKYYADQGPLADLMHQLQNPGMRSDLLRYLILYRIGGVYTDIDTAALKPIDEWVPTKWRQDVRMIVGIEYDRRDGMSWADIPHDLQFCQWTIAAAAGHPILKDMADRVMTSVEWLAKTHSVTVAELQPSSFEVMNSTGPAAWTDVVMDHIKLVDPTVTDWTNLSRMTEPRLFGDVMVLPINGFGTGQAHSGSVHDGTIPDDALLVHHFRGSWRGD